MMRFSTFAVLGLVVLLAHSFSDQQDQQRNVYSIRPTTSVRLAWLTKRTEPSVINSRDQLMRFMPNRDDEDAVRKQLDFATHQLVVFAWKGNANDRINVNPDVSPVQFAHWGNDPGKDPHVHCRMFAVAKSIKFSAIIEPDPR